MNSGVNFISVDINCQFHEVPLQKIISKDMEKTIDVNLERVRTFIKTRTWHFAHTMPKIPHWYCLKEEDTDEKEFLWFAKYIRENSLPGTFYGKTYYYFYLDGYKYWWMEENVDDCLLVNRDRVIGYVYILINPCLKENWIKIGSAASLEDVCAKELRNSDLPLPYKMYATLETVNYVSAEKLIRRYIETYLNLQIHKDSKFFNIKPKEALALLRKVAEVVGDCNVEVLSSN